MSCILRPPAGPRARTQAAIVADLLAAGFSVTMTILSVTSTSTTLSNRYVFANQIVISNGSDSSSSSGTRRLLQTGSGSGAIPAANVLIQNGSSYVGGLNLQAALDQDIAVDVQSLFSNGKSVWSVQNYAAGGGALDPAWNKPTDTLMINSGTFSSVNGSIAAFGICSPAPAATFSYYDFCMGTLPNEAVQSFADWQANGNNLLFGCYPGSQNISWTDTNGAIQTRSCEEYCAEFYRQTQDWGLVWLHYDRLPHQGYVYTSTPAYTLSGTSLTFVGRQTILAKATLNAGTAQSPVYSANPVSPFYSTTNSPSIPIQTTIPPAFCAPSTYYDASTVVSGITAATVHTDCTTSTVTTILSATQTQIVLLRSVPSTFTGLNTIDGGAGVNLWSIKSTTIAGCGSISVLTRIG